MKKYFILGLACLLLNSGCERNDLLTEDLLDSQMASMKIDDLSRTLDFVFSDSRFDQKEFEDKIATGLNRWVGETIKEGKAEDNWTLDNAVKEIVSANQGLPVLSRQDELTYLNSDGYYLQQAAWMKKIGERVTSSTKLSAYEFYRLAADNSVDDDSENSFDQIVGKLHPNLNEDDAKELAKAIRLFDWVTRNIQLTTPEEIGSDRYDEFRVNTSEDPIAAGVPGIGYPRFPWQTLVYGRGDFVQKANLFVALCQQQGLDVVVLAYKGEEDELVPWLPALMLGENLYLFDSYLGLPLPGEKPGSVATLADVQANGELLSGLDLSLEESTRDNAKYRVKPDEIKELTALVYTSPEMVSRRMKFLEDKMLGDNRMILTVNPTELIARADSLDGVTGKAWDIGFQTHQFRTAIKTAIDEVRTGDSSLREKLAWYYTDEAYIDSFVTYRTARNLYFIGKFESDRGSRRLNAIQMFYSLMYTDENIAGLATNRRLMYRLGIRKDANQSAGSFNDRLTSVQSQMEMVRRDAGLFLAQSQFDNGNVGTSANWLRRVEEKGISERWNCGVHYLHGRAFESTKEYDKALEIYEKGEDEQFHGNLIRARLLKQVLDQGDSNP